MPVSAASTAIYHYQKLETYTLHGLNGGMTFDKPLEFKEFGSAPAKSMQVLLIHLPATKIVPDYGRIGAMTFSYSPTPQYLSSLNAALTDKNNIAYKTNVGGFEAFINPRLPTSYKAAGFKSFQPFSSKNLALTAWASDFSATSADKRLPKLEGKFIVIYGGATQYFFMAENVASTWQANSSIWETVFSSIKADQ